MLESTIERRVCAWLKKEHGLMSSKLVTPGQTGYPDRIIWIPGGKPMLVEFKRPGEKPTKKQQYIISELQKLGYDVYISTGIDDVWRVE